MKSTLRFFVISCAMLSGLASAAEVTLETDQQKLSYVLGFQLGKQFQQQGFDVDVTTLGLAIQEAMNDAEPRLNGEQARAVMEKQQKKQMEAQAQAGSKNAEAGEKFLADNKGKPGVVTLENGLQYKVVKAGSGKKPKETDSVTVHYRGTLIDGTEFDSSYSRGEPTSFPVNRVISGWTQVLQMMEEGATWQVYIPSDLAYGARGAGAQIGPNSTLIFDIELIKVNDTDSAG